MSQQSFLTVWFSTKLLFPFHSRKLIQRWLTYKKAASKRLLQSKFILKEKSFKLWPLNHQSAFHTIINKQMCLQKSVITYQTHPNELKTVNEKSQILNIFFYLTPKSTIFTDNLRNQINELPKLILIAYIFLDCMLLQYKQR